VLAQQKLVQRVQNEDEWGKWKPYSIEIKAQLVYQTKYGSWFSYQYHYFLNILWRFCDSTWGLDWKLDLL
jgi:hypothetical protein